MPIGFAKNILAGSSASAFANTQAATWAVLAGRDGFTTFDGKFNDSLMSDFDGNNEDCDSTIRIYPANTNFKFNKNFAYTIEFFLGFSNTSSIPQSHDIMEITADHTEGLDDTTTTNGRITANGQNVFFHTQGDSGGVTYSRSNFGGNHHSGAIHVALVSDGSGNQAWYADGSRVMNTTYTTTASDEAVAVGFRGTRNSSSPRVAFDEIRISDIARYSGTSLTVPTSAFTTDANTLALFHCDGNQNDSSRG